MRCFASFISESRIGRMERFVCFHNFTRPFPFNPPRRPHPSALRSKPFFPFITTVSQSSHGTWPPPLVSLLICPVCVVCHFVNVYPTPPFFFAHHDFFTPLICGSVRCPFDHVPIPLSDTCFASVKVDPSPTLRAFQEDSTLDIPMFHLCRHWFIYHRYDCDAM